MSRPALPSALASAAPFGCAYTLTLGLGMAAGVFLGNVMGDCAPGVRCHEHAGAMTARGIVWAVPIALTFGAGAWLLFAGFFALLKGRASDLALAFLCALLALVLAWLSFDPALRIHLSWTMSRQPRTQPVRAARRPSMRRSPARASKQRRSARPAFADGRLRDRRRRG